MSLWLIILDSSDQRVTFRWQGNARNWEARVLGWIISLVLTSLYFCDDLTIHPGGRNLCCQWIIRSKGRDFDWTLASNQGAGDHYVGQNCVMCPSNYRQIYLGTGTDSPSLDTRDNMYQYKNEYKNGIFQNVGSRCWHFEIWLALLMRSADTSVIFALTTTICSLWDSH